MSDPITQLRYNQSTQSLEGTTGSAGWNALVLTESGSLALTNTHIFVGNASNLAVDVALSGDAGITNTGVLTISSGAIVDSKINATAAIALSKLTALSANIVPITNGSGVLASSSTTATELGYVHGVTSAIQTQINTKFDTAGTGLSAAGTTISNAGITSIHADAGANITGAAQLVSGTNITLSQASNAITINATGVGAAGAAGSIQFSNGSGGFLADNAHLYFDNTNKFVGLNSTTPLTPVAGNGKPSLVIRTDGTYSGIQFEDAVDGDGLGPVYGTGIAGMCYRLKSTEPAFGDGALLIRGNGFVMENFFGDSGHDNTWQLGCAFNGNVFAGNVGANHTSWVPKSRLCVNGQGNGSGYSGLCVADQSITGSASAPDNGLLVMGQSLFGTTTTTSSSQVVTIGTNEADYVLGSGNTHTLTGNIKYNVRSQNGTTSQGVILGYDSVNTTVGVVAVGGGSAIMSFWTNNGTATAERARIHSNGNVGINDTTCSYPLSVAGDIATTSAGNGLRIKEGTNARMGTSVLSSGAVVVSNTSVTANTRIFLTSQVDGGTPGFLRISTRTAGTSFTITSSNVLDTSTVAWLLVEPA